MSHRAGFFELAANWFTLYERSVDWPTNARTKTADTDLRAEIAADLEALAQPGREFSSMVMHIMRQCGEFG